MTGWAIYSAKNVFVEFSAAWDGLNSRLNNGHPFLDSRFVGPLLDNFGNGSELLCVHHTTSDPSGFLILCPPRYGIWSTFSPAQMPIAPLLLEDGRLIETLIAALPGTAWTLELYGIDLHFFPDFSMWAWCSIATPKAQTISVEMGSRSDQFDRYWRNRPKKLQANISRYLRRASGHVLRLAKHTDKADVRAAVSRYGNLESAGWKGEAGTALADNNPQGVFYSETLERFAMAKQAAVYELYVDDRLAASRLIINGDHMVILLKTTYAESMASLAPGRLLLYLFLREQLTLDGGKPIHFYTNATRDQKEWSTTQSQILDMQIFKTPLYAGAFSAARAFRRKLHITRGDRRPPQIESRTPNVTECNGVDTLSPSQYDLRDFVGRDCMESSVDWFRLLQRTIYPSDPGVRYYVVAETNIPLVILPVRFTVNRLVKSVTSLSNYYTSLYGPLVRQDSNPLSLGHALATAVRENKGIQVMRFAPMDPNASTYAALLSGLRANDWVPFQFSCFGNWFLPVRGTWQDYLKSRSRNLRSSIVRRCKKFAIEGGTIEIVSTTGYIEESIAEFQRVYAASWKQPEPYPDFIPELIRQLAAMGMLRLGFARLRGQAIATQLWFVDRTKASIYKVAYDESFASYAPGTVLTAHLMQHVIDCDHVQEVDFLIGDDSYKKTWMSDRRERFGIVAYDPSTIIGFALLMREALGRALRSVAGRIGPVFSRLRSFCGSGANRSPRRRLAATAHSSVKKP